MWSYLKIVSDTCGDVYGAVVGNSNVKIIDSRDKRIISKDDLDINDFYMMDSEEIEFDTEDFVYILSPEEAMRENMEDEEEKRLKSNKENRQAITYIKKVFNADHLKDKMFINEEDYED